MSLWTPAEIPLLLWLDPADPASVALSGTRITHVYDKSGGNRDAVNSLYGPTLIENAINGLSVMRFPGNNTYIFNMDGKLPSSAEVTVRVVIHKPTYGGARWQRAWASSDGTDTDYLAGGIFHIPAWGSDGRAAGGPEITEGSVNASGENHFASFRIGHNPFSSSYGPFFGDLGEFIIASPKLSLLDEQKLDGYLYHRWGLQADLAADHPYKDNPPTTAPPKQFYGVVTDKDGVAAERTVIVVKESTMEVVTNITSDPVTGEYLFVPPQDEGPYTLVFLGEPDRNAQVFSGVQPADPPE